MRNEGQVRMEGKARIAVKARVTRGAESWQFFAFVFAAVAFLEFAWLGQIPNVWGRLVAETAAFVVTFYVVMLNARVRNWLVGQLNSRIKPEG